MTIKVNDMWARIKQFLQDNEQKIVLVLGFILVAVVSFEAGLLKGQGNQEKPLVIEKTANLTGEGQKPAEDALAGSKMAPGTTLASSDTNAGGQNAPQNCAFVGSKNSNKYHLPTCRWAKNIKPENVVCFSSAEDALKKGYQPDKNCIK
jgi:hypothetical protein